MSHVSLGSNIEARYWMQVPGVTRFQLEAATQAVGTQVEMVMDYLSIPDRRVVRERLIVAHLR
jgi:hypothetical protein